MNWEPPNPHKRVNDSAEHYRTLALVFETSEADLIRPAIANAVSRPRPYGGFLDAPPFAETSDDVLAGFGVC